MNIIVNGKPHDAPDEATVVELLESLELTGQRLALLLDDEVVRKAEFPNTRLQEGSCVEIVQMVGGG